SPEIAADVEARLRAISGELAARAEATGEAVGTPTLMAGLPAATAGLALAVPPAGEEPDAGEEPSAGHQPDAAEGDARGRLAEAPSEGETVVLPADPTAALPVGSIASATAKGPREPGPPGR